MTILESLQQHLPEPYLSEAIEELLRLSGELRLNSKFTVDGLCAAFRWSDTKKGSKYWQNVHKKHFALIKKA